MSFEKSRQFFIRVFSERWSLWGILAIGFVVRGSVFLLHIDNGIQDADEAVVGLMAKHIAEGSDFPIIWYGQQYFGTLPSWINAAIFSIIGISSNAVRIVPLLLSVLAMYLVYRLSFEMFGKSVGLLSGLWMALCPPFLVIFSLKQAGYMLTLVLGTTILLLTYCFSVCSGESRKRSVLIAFLGGLIGFGVWVHLQIASYVAASLIFLIWKARRHLSVTRLVLLVGGAFIGGSPLLVDTLLRKGHTLKFLFDTFQLPDPQSAWTVGSRIYNCLVVGLPVLLGGGPIWSFHWISFTWTLHPLLGDAVFITTLILLTSLLSGICAYVGWRQREIVRIPHTKNRILIVIIPVVLLLVYTWWLFGTYLLELFPLLPGETLTWTQFEGAPVLTPGFLLQELFSPALLIYAVYIPAILYCAITLQHRHKERAGIQLSLLTLLLVVASYVGTRYGDLRSPRYLMPAYSVLPILLAVFTVGLARRKKLMAGMLWAVVLAVHLFGLIEMPPSYYLQPLQYINWWNPDQSQLVPPSNTPVIEFLHSHQIAHVYAKYWLGIPVIFDSKESIMTSAGTEGRYPMFDEEVAHAERVAYIFHRNSFEHQSFEHIIRNAGISYKKTQITEYVVYYDVALPDRLNSPLWPSIVKLLHYP